MAVITGSDGSEYLFGSFAADFIDARGADDSLVGGGGDDTLLGGAGNDSFEGGTGANILTGGAGSDSFFFRSTESSLDSVTDFVRASDKLVFDNNFFSGIGAPGAFAAGDARFASGAGLTAGQDPTDRLIYDSASGDLYFDFDGSGAGASQRVATLQGAPALAASDIQVVGLGGVEIIGGTDPDRLTGSGYDDTIAGGMGTDTMTGGAGGDRFLITAGPAIQYEDGVDRMYASLVLEDAHMGNLIASVCAAVDMAGGHNAGNAAGRVDPDRITDFAAEDQLLFESSVLPALGGAGTWGAGDGRFAAGAGFTSGRDASDRLVYDTSTGSLYYDADGSGGGEAQLVAVLQGTPSLAASDITVI